MVARTKQLEEAMQVKSRFLAVMSHVCAGVTTLGKHV